MKVVGISGEMFAGKTTAARILERLGFSYTRISEVIDDVLRERSEPINRENQQRVGLELHQELGQAWLCARAVDRLGRPPPTKVVVDGLRWPEDAKYFRHRFATRFLHIDIFAPGSVRRERAVSAGRQNEFDRAEHHPVESGVDAVGELADVVIGNESDIASLRRKVFEAVEGGGFNAG